MRTLHLITVSLLALGCKPEPEVTRYEVKPDTASAPAAPNASTPSAASAPPMVAPPSMKAEAASFDAPQWANLPSGWAVGPENAMRKATWIITTPDGEKAEIAVTVFPGNVGGVTANVNRWRGQIGLPPASANDIAASAKTVHVSNVESQRFIMTSSDGKKSLDAILTPHKGATWFFKMSGDSPAVAAHGESFVAFLAASKLP